MKLHAVALLASALFFAGCAQSVEEIYVSNPDLDGGTGDSSTGRDSGSIDTGSIDTGSEEEDTGTEEDTGSLDDSGEFPDYGGGGGDDGGGGGAESGTEDSGGGGGGGACTMPSDCPGACCDTTSGKCGVDFGGFCIAF